MCVISTLPVSQYRKRRRVYYICNNVRVQERKESRGQGYLNLRRRQCESGRLPFLLLVQYMKLQNPPTQPTRTDYFRNALQEPSQQPELVRFSTDQTMQKTFDWMVMTSWKPLALTRTLTVTTYRNSTPSRGRYCLKNVFWNTWNHIIRTFRHLFHNFSRCKGEGRGSLVERSERSGAQDHALFTVQQDGRFWNCSRSVSPCIEIQKVCSGGMPMDEFFCLGASNPMNMVTLTARKYVE